MFGKAWKSIILSKPNMVFRKYTLKAYFIFAIVHMKIYKYQKSSQSPSLFFRLKLLISGSDYIPTYKCEQELAVGCISEICVSV